MVKGRLLLFIINLNMDPRAVWTLAFQNLALFASLAPFSKEKSNYRVKPRAQRFPFPRQLINFSNELHARDVNTTQFELLYI
jgi:hypothetical protein